MTPPVVARLVDVAVWFPGTPSAVRALDGIAVELRAGEHWALLGANGSGKSTLLGLLAGQRHPSAGTAELLGARLGRVDLRALRERIGVVDARLRIPPALTVRDYVLTGATQTVQPLPYRYDAAAHARVAALLDLVGLRGIADRRMDVLSQGERARARLARALVARPALLLLDEPAAGLDLPGRADLLGALERLAAEDPGVTTVVVAHHLEELPATTTHVALLRAGRLLATGTTSLLDDAAALTACFARPVRPLRVDGRWYAVTGARAAPPSP